MNICYYGLPLNERNLVFDKIGIFIFMFQNQMSFIKYYGSQHK